MSLRLFACNLLFLASLHTHADVVVQNHQTDSAVNYQVVLLRGTCTQNTPLHILNKAAPATAQAVVPTIEGGRFKALVKLSPGRNEIEISQEGQGAALQLVLSYVPQTNPYYLRLVWLTDSSGDTDYATPDHREQDYENRLRTAGLLMQTFTAERMHDLGYGRSTFRLERDQQGEVVVHTWKGDRTADEYYALGDSNAYWGAVHHFANTSHPDPYAKNCVLSAFTRKDAASGKMKGHTARGGGNLGLFGSASVFSWPSTIQGAAAAFLDATPVDPKQVHDDSAGRHTNWGLASTTLGATLHEMGHTFGLPHCTDGLGIMTRGFDRFNRVFTLTEPKPGKGVFPANQEAYFAPISTSYLQHSPWFWTTEREVTTDAPPKVTIQHRKGRVVIESSAGIPWVGFWVDADIHDHEEINQTPLPKRLEFTIADLEERLGGKRLSRVSVIGANGKSATARRMKLGR